MEAVDIGSRLELFVDGLSDRQDGGSGDPISLTLVRRHGPGIRSSLGGQHQLAIDRLQGRRPLPDVLPGPHRAGPMRGKPG